MAGLCAGVNVTWKPGEQHRETKEFEIFRAASEDGPFESVASVSPVFTYVEAPSRIGTKEDTVNVDSTEGFPAQRPQTG